MSFFVVLRSQQGAAIPMVAWDDDGPKPELQLFETEDEAEVAARGTLFGECFGFEVFEW